MYSIPVQNLADSTMTGTTVQTVYGGLELSRGIIEIYPTNTGLVTNNLGLKNFHNILEMWGLWLTVDTTTFVKG